MPSLNIVELTQALVQQPSITPVKEDDAAAIAKKTAALNACFDILEKELKPLGFECHRLVFEEKGLPSIPNLYARRGKSGKNFCFLGHVDVVPPGDAKSWSVDPFSATIKNGIMIGRGTSDMKSGVAASVVGAREFLKDYRGNDSISLMVTGDEEKYAVNGVPKILKWLEARQEKIDYCLVAEPSSPFIMGEEIKNGRRGSVNVNVKAKGKQGHVAYVGQFDNPITRLGRFIARYSSHQLDQGNAHFEPTNMEVTILNCANQTSNVVPSEVSCWFNIRWTTDWNKQSLTQKIVEMCDATIGQGHYELEWEWSGDPFLTPPGPFVQAIMQSVTEVTGKVPKPTTDGGTSDGRFVAKYCQQVVECGVTSETIHQVDERVALADLEQLPKIFAGILRKILK
ncbi:MAG: succinyl-diaminopimelate desuccinylase [Dongiaceae bacterium]